MNPRDGKQDGSAAAESPAPQGLQRPYAPPKLTRFGSLSDITRSGGTLPQPDAPRQSAISG